MHLDVTAEALHVGDHRHDLLVPESLRSALLHDGRGNRLRLRTGHRGCLVQRIAVGHADHRHRIHARLDLLEVDRLGQEVRTAVLETSLSDLFYHTDVNVSAVKWLKLTYQKTGLRVVLQAANVVSRMAQDEGCQLTVLIGNDQKTIAVNESRDEIKAMTDGPAAPVEETE